MNARQTRHAQKFFAEQALPQGIDFTQLGVKTMPANVIPVPLKKFRARDTAHNVILLQHGDGHISAYKLVRGSESRGTRADNDDVTIHRLRFV